MKRETVGEGLAQLLGPFAVVIAALNVQCIAALKQRTGPAMWGY